MYRGGKGVGRREEGNGGRRERGGGGKEKEVEAGGRGEEGRRGREMAISPMIASFVVSFFVFWSIIKNGPFFVLKKKKKE